MGGSNPYIEQTKYTPATKKFKVTFVREGKTIEVDPEKVPYAREGLPGSILDIATGFHMGLDHACGGVCACSTCHVIVREGLESCNEATDDELDQLDEAVGVEAKSRLDASVFPMERATWSSKSQSGIRISPRKRNTNQNSGNANLPVGGLRDANREIGVPGLSPMDSRQSRKLPSICVRFLQ